MILLEVNLLALLATLCEPSKGSIYPTHTFATSTLGTHMKFTQPVPAGGAIQTKLRLVVGRWLTWEATTLHINWLPNWWSDIIPARQKGRDFTKRTNWNSPYCPPKHNDIWSMPSILCNKTVLLMLTQVKRLMKNSTIWKQLI